MSTIQAAGGAVAVQVESLSGACQTSGVVAGENLLPEPEPAAFRLPAGDVGAELAKLVLEASHADKKLGREIRDSEEKAQLDAEKAQLAALREKAEENFKAGLASGIASIGSGAAGAGTAGCEEPGRQAGTSGGKALEGLGQIVSAVSKQHADMADEEATRQQQLASHHQRASEDSRDAIGDAKDLIDRALDFYKEYNAAKADAQKAAFLRS